MVVKRGRRLRLTTSLPSMSRLYRQCGILNISKAYRPQLPGTGTYLLLFTFILIVTLLEAICAAEKAI
jgi:hypothetical protein